MDMNKALVIDIDSVGRASALHMDEFDLGILGDKKIRRASSIEFCEQAQSFQVILDGDDAALDCATQFSGYDVARRFEVRWLQQCAVQRIDPRSPEGRTTAQALRSGREEWRRV